MGKWARKVVDLIKTTYQYKVRSATRLKFWLDQERQFLNSILGGPHVVWGKHNLLLQFQNPAQDLIDFYKLGSSTHGSGSLSADSHRPDWILTYSNAIIYRFEDMSIDEIYSWMLYWAKSYDFDLKDSTVEGDWTLISTEKLLEYKTLMKLSYLCRGPRYAMIQDWMKAEWKGLLELFDGVSDPLVKVDWKSWSIQKGPVKFLADFNNSDGTWFLNLSCDKESVGDEFNLQFDDPEIDLLEITRSFVDPFKETYAKFVIREYTV